MERDKSTTVAGNPASLQHNLHYCGELDLWSEAFPGIPEGSYGVWGNELYLVIPLQPPAQAESPS